MRRAIIAGAAVVLIAVAVAGCDREQSASAPPASPATTDAAVAEDDRWSGDIVTREVVIGELNLPSGKVVACDGFVIDSNTPPFSLAVPPGKYPVVLTLARSRPGDDERVAYAAIRFAPAKPARWEMAVGAGNDPKSLKADEVFAYGVDSGTGCFMDPVALAAL